MKSESRQGHTTSNELENTWGAAYVRIRETTVVVHDLGTQKVPKRRQAEFKNILTSALKLVRVIQTLVELKCFFTPERSTQRKEHVRILKGAEKGETAVSAG